MSSWEKICKIFHGFTNSAKVIDSTSDFVSLKFPQLLRLSRSNESDKADIVVNLLFSKQETTQSPAEKIFFYRRGRGEHIITWFVGKRESKTNAPMVCSLPEIDTYATPPPLMPKSSRQGVISNRFVG